MLGSRHINSAVPIVLGIIIAGGLYTLSEIINQKTLETYQHKAGLELKSDMHPVAQTISSSISAATANINAISIYLEKNRSLNSAEGVEALSQYSSSLGKTFEAPRTIIVVNNKGIVIDDLRPGKPAVGYAVLDREYFQAHLKQPTNTPHIFSPIKSKIDAKRTWTISQAARNNDGSLMAVVVASFGNQYLEDITSSFKDKADAFVLLHDSGVILSATGSFKDKTGDTVVPSNSMDRGAGIMEARADTLASVTFDGPHYAKKIESWPVSIVSIPSRSYAASISIEERNETRLWFVLFGALTLLSVFAIWLSTKKLIIANKNIEMMLKETSILHQQSTSASIAKSEFLANMSHELRTPLNAIIGFSETIRSHVFGPIGNNKYDEYANHIHAAGEHLLQLINNILDVSAIEAGKLELFEEPNDLNDIFDQATNLVRDKAEEKNVLINKAATTDMPLIMCDGLRIKQIFLNLLSNAITFTPSGGSVTFQARRDVGGDLLVSVSDTGIGMDDEGIEKAMSHFGQVDGTLSRTHAGTGLGLPLSLDLIELHGGSLTIESALGKGTTVTLRLPKSKILGKHIQD